MAKHYCRHCREPWDHGTHCPKCGTAEENYALLVISIVFGVLLFLSVMLILVCELILPDLVEKYNSQTSASVYESRAPEETRQHLEAQTRPAQTEPTVPAGQWYAGLYEVGADIPAGEYVIMSDGELVSEIGESFHVSIFNDDTLDDNDRAFGGWVENNMIIRAEDGQFIELLHAVMYSADEPSRLAPFEKPGMFCVGRDLPAGTYLLVSTNDQYGGMCVYGTDLQSVQQEWRDAVFLREGEEQYVTLSDGDYVRTEFCRLAPTGGAFVSNGE